MLRLALFTPALLLVGCATARTNELVASDSNAAFVGRTPYVEVAPALPDAAEDAHRAEPVGTLEAEAAPGRYTLDPATLPSAAAAADESLHGNRFTIKAGSYGAQENALDTGYIIELSWMRFFSKLFALEFELGYVNTDGDDSGTKTDVWAIPVMLNGRLNLPIWVLEGYAGLGLGGFYYDASASGVLNEDDSGFLWGGNAFFGASVNLGDSFALGLEAKYYVTDDISSLNANLDAFALMLTLGFSR